MVKTTLTYFFINKLFNKDNYLNKNNILSRAVGMVLRSTSDHHRKLILYALSKQFDFSLTLVEKAGTKVLIGKNVQ